MSGGTVLLVPIRSLIRGKSRLSGALTQEQRAALTKRMLAGVIEAAVGSGVVQTVVVISPDRAVLELVARAHPLAVGLLQRLEYPGLNGAIEQGRTWATDRGAAVFVVLFGDLPLIDATDVQHLVRRDAPVVIAPDRHGTGTNALLLRQVVTDLEQPPFRFGFGVGSYAHHVDEAHRLGLDVAVSLAPGTAFDLDTPDDLEMIFGADTIDVAASIGLDGASIGLSLKTASTASMFGETGTIEAAR